MSGERNECPDSLFGMAEFHSDCFRCTVLCISFLMLSLSVFYKSALRNSSFHGGEDVVGVEVWLIFSCLFIPIMTSILNRIVLSRSIHGQLTSWIDATIIVAFATAPVIAYSIRM